MKILVMESIGPLKLVAAIHHEVDGLTLVCSSHKVMTALIIVKVFFCSFLPNLIDGSFEAMKHVYGPAHDS